jgi:hypothetical protein
MPGVCGMKFFAVLEDFKMMMNYEKRLVILSGRYIPLIAGLQNCYAELYRTRCFIYERREKCIRELLKKAIVFFVPKKTGVKGMCFIVIKVVQPLCV